MFILNNRKGIKIHFILFIISLSILVSRKTEASYVIDGGDCWSNIYWELDNEYTLTCSAKTGALIKIGDTPWKNYKESIKKLIIGNGVTEISDDKFRDYPILEYVELPYSMKSIDARVFWGCSNLQIINIPESTEKIGSAAFYKCGLKTISIPNAAIDNGAFQLCENLKSVSIGKGVVNIASNAFINCTALERIDVDASNAKYSSLDGVLFNKYKTILYVVPASADIISYRTPDSVAVISLNAFRKCKYLQLVEMTDTVETIEKYAFQNAQKLSSVKLSNSLLSIPEGCFSGCTALKELTIPENTTSIGKDAFSDCTSLEKLFFCGNAPELAEGLLSSFEGEIYYPENNATWTDDYMNGLGNDIHWIPYSVPDPTPTGTPIPTIEPTVTPTSPPNPTITPTSTPDPTETPTPTPEPTVTPTPTVSPSASLSLDNLSYSFGNTPEYFPSSGGKYSIGLPTFRFIFGKNTKAVKWYDYNLTTTSEKFSGNCAGFAGSSAILNDSSSGISFTDFNAAASSIAGLSSNNVASKFDNLSVAKFIETFQIIQYTQLFIEENSKNLISTNLHLRKGLKNLNSFYNTVRSETDAGRPVLLALRQDGLGHAVLAYKVEEESGSESTIWVYDSNYPRQERKLTLKKDIRGDFMEWSYEIRADYGEWGTKSSLSSISFIPYSAIKEIWMTRGNLAENQNVVLFNSGSVAIYNSADKQRPVATLTQGNLNTVDYNIYVIENLSLEPRESDSVMLSMPIDVYTFKNLDSSVEKFSVSVTDTNLAAEVSTTADGVTLAVDDSCNLNAVYIDAKESDTYSITLNSSFSYDDDNVVVTGRGSGETMEVSQTKGNISINNCQIASITVDGKDISKYQITASAGVGGKITPDGTKVITRGESAEFKIQSNAGYEISAVLVDGKNVGAVTTYKFTDINDNHVIKAEFRKTVTENTTPIGKNTTADNTATVAKTSANENGKNKNEGEKNKEKQTNVITAEDVILTAAKKEREYIIPAQCQGGAKLSYHSNNSSIRINEKGNIVIPKNYVGQALIRIISEETDQYYSASKVISMTVNPAGTSITKLKRNGSGQMTVTWKRNKNVTGYQLSYSTSSKFKNAKTVTIKKNKTVKKVLKKLKKKKYYVRIRTYKVVSGKKFFSNWSKSKKANLN